MKRWHLPLHDYVGQLLLVSDISFANVRFGSKADVSCLPLWVENGHTTIDHPPNNAFALTLAFLSIAIPRLDSTWILRLAFSE